jgi:hypothetical protein
MLYKGSIARVRNTLSASWMKNGFVRRTENKAVINDGSNGVMFFVSSKNFLFENQSCPYSIFIFLG